MAAVLGSFATVSNAVLADSHMGEGRKGKMMERVDTDGDGFISKSEFVAKHEKMFAKIDSDGDGKISKEEMKNAHKDRKEKRQDRREKRMDAE